MAGSVFFSFFGGGGGGGGGWGGGRGISLFQRIITSSYHLITIWIETGVTRGL